MFCSANDMTQMFVINNVGIISAIVKPSEY